VILYSIKKTDTGSNKKLILAIATLGVVLIIVVMLMNSMNSSSNTNLPQAVLPPKPQKEVQQHNSNQEPLFEEVKVLQDDTTEDADLDKIAQKLKQESQTTTKTKKESVQKVQKVIAQPKKITKKVVRKAPSKVIHKTVKHTKAVSTAHYYVQVGSFSKYAPNKKFLTKIKQLNFNYKYHKVGKLNKVLVGPFETKEEAKTAKKILRAKVAHGAFLLKL